MEREIREAPQAKNQIFTEPRGERPVALVPGADIIETSNSLIVIADMPGVDEMSVDIHVEHNVLTVAGRAQAEKFEGFQLGYQEFESGRFARQFTLSDEVDVNGIEASDRHGVLGIRLPKVEKRQDPQDLRQGWIICAGELRDIGLNTMNLVPIEIKCAKEPRGTGNT